MFGKLLFAHLIADFVLQNQWMVRHKCRWDGLSVHIGIVFLTMAIMVWDKLPEWWLWLLFIAAIHALIDWTKVSLEPRLKLPPILTFLADQVGHLLVICAAIWLNGLTALPLSLAASFFHDDDRIWDIANLYVTCTFAASIALPVWLNPPSLMKRSFAARLAIIVAGATILTLAWQGFYLYIPLATAGFIGFASHYLNKTSATATLATEILSASALAAAAGLALH